jgi:hypothetical protein
VRTAFELQFKLPEFYGESSPKTYHFGLSATETHVIVTMVLVNAETRAYVRTVAFAVEIPSDMERTRHRDCVIDPQWISGADWEQIEDNVVPVAHVAHAYGRPPQ